MEMLRQVIIKALEDKYNAQISAADATIKIYLEKPVGIGEHPQHIDEVDKLIEKRRSSAREVIKALNHAKLKYNIKYDYEGISSKTYWQFLINVIDTESYQNYETRWGEGNDKDRSLLFQRYLSVEGYKPMMESLRNKGEKSNTMQMLNMFPEADGVMFVSMGYDFVKKAVPFTAGVQAYIKIKLWNREGKRVFVIHELGTSKKSVGIIGGIPLMKAEKLLPLCESASEKLVADLSKKVKKISKKAAKKL